MGRRKRVADETLLAIARKVFVEKGFAASTRSIARRARISEAVIYQRYPTKLQLFFAAMVPPALDVEALLAAPAEDRGVQAHLEDIAIGTMGYFRQVVPILLPLLTHPSFDFEEFARAHPDTPFHRMRQGLGEYLEAQQRRGTIAPGSAQPAALTLFAALHCLAILERAGLHGGKFDDQAIRAVARTLWTGLAPRK
jgi:AcrR family transcriptional regulator